MMMNQQEDNKQKKNSKVLQRFRSSAVLEDHVDLEELLVLETHIAEEARDRLRLHLGQFWGVFELENGVQCVLLVDLMLFRLEMVSAEVACG
jgi:hypothetical protein